MSGLRCRTMVCNRQSRLRVVLLAAIVAAGATLHCHADAILSEDVGNLTWKYTVTNGAARVYGGHMKTAIGWTAGEVAIPDTLGGLTVKAIGSYAFFELGEMTSLKIPECVETIEFYACRGCTNLVTATLPSNLTTLGNAVFFNCSKLDVGYIPDSVTSMGRDTFWGCTSMRTVKFSSHVGDIGAMTCYNCDSLTEVTIPDCVTNIGVSAFLNCDNLRSATLPQGEVTFGNYAFNNCLSLEVVDIPSGFTDFDNAFHNCPSLTTVRIRQDIAHVDPASFIGCPTLTNIAVEAGNAVYQSIGGVLYDITGKELVAWPAALQPVTIPASVERIGAYAFGWTSDQAAIVIPDGVMVSDLAFAAPPGEPEEPPPEPSTPVEPNPDAPNGATIYRNCFRIVPGQIPHLACTVSGLEGIDYAVDKFATNNWQVVIHGYGMNDSRIRKAPEGEHYVDDNNMPAGVYGVAGTCQPFVFEFCNWYRNGALGSRTWYGYVSIALDENAELVILESAICNQQNVLTVVGPRESISAPLLDFETIDHGDWLELGCQCIPADTIGDITIPSEIGAKPVLAIGNRAFDSCSRVATITIPDGVLSIGDYAFSGCSSLSSLVIPSSVTNVGYTALNACRSLGELRIDAPLATFGYKAFAHCGVTNLVLASGITNIDNYAFADCRRLASVTIPQSVQRICTWSFDENCKSLKSVSVPYATIIEDAAFPPGCAITRYGPYIVVPGDLLSPDEDTKIAMMRTLDWKDYAGLDEVYFHEMQPPYAETPESRSAIYASAHLGISPAIIDGEQSEHYTVACYKMPSVEFLDIDPATRTITGRVVPAEGTQIVSAPLKRAFGFHRIYEDDGRWFEGNDWGYWLNEDVPGFSLDTSDYITSNGIFRITYGEEVLFEKGPRSEHLFKIKLSDKRRLLW